MRLSRWLVMLVLVGLLPAAARAEEKPKLRVLQTPGGVRFGLLGEKGAVPAPTLVILAASIEVSLGNADYNRIGTILNKHGFLCVALDVPCHGEDRQASEPEGLAGWRFRLEHGDNWLPRFTKNASAVLDYLIQHRYTDAERVAACGTSRGGFIALHFAAAEPRIKSVVAFAPVTDLLALTEFKGMNKHAATRSLALAHFADKLVGRALWVCIGNHDDRVGTDLTIALCRAVTAADVAKGKPADVELHVMPTLGHTIHQTAHEEAAAWVLKHVEKGSK
jgi:dienelactone hydrolase